MKHTNQPRWLNDKLMWARESATVTLAELVSSTSIQQVLGGKKSWEELPRTYLELPLMQTGEFNTPRIGDIACVNTDVSVTFCIKFLYGVRPLRTMQPGRSGNKPGALAI